MRAVLGIGNPGKKYIDTRHNIGFIILNKFAEKHNLLFKAAKGDYYIAGSESNATPFFLIKPSAYVNLSGIAAKEFLESYQINIEDLLVVTDDINLQTGKIRIRKSGGDGGHNGLSSIIFSLQSDQFPRLRFGIGNNFVKGNMADFVLDKFSSEDQKIINPAIDTAVEIISQFLNSGFNTALNFFSNLNTQSAIISNTNNINKGN